MSRQIKPLDLTGLAQFRSSSLLDEPKASLFEAQETALDLIDFDPSQPRRNMGEENLKALAASIKIHGVLEPVSLRLHPSAAGRYVVNRGERRVRASQMAGKTSVPAFLDVRVDPFSQAVENLHREDMSPFDLCKFIIEREREGFSRGEIAKRLVKSKSYITMVASLQDASADVRRAFEGGRVRDVRALYELVHALPEYPEVVNALLASPRAITRSDIQVALSKRAAVDAIQSAPSNGGCIPAARVRHRTCSPMAHLLVETGDRLGQLSLIRESQDELGQVVFDDGSVESIPLSRLRLLRWAEARDLIDSSRDK